MPERLLLERFFGDKGIFLPNSPFYRPKFVVEARKLGLLCFELLLRRVVGSLLVSLTSKRDNHPYLGIILLLHQPV